MQKQFNTPVYYKNFLANNSEYVFAGAKPNGTPLTSANSAANIAAGSWGQVTQGVSFVGTGKSTFSLEGGKRLWWYIYCTNIPYNSWRYHFWI